MKKLLLTAAACAVTCLAAPAVAAPGPAAYIVATRDTTFTTYSLVSPGEIAKGKAVTRVVEPQISGWAMAMLSFAGFGSAVRAARRRLLRSVNTCAF